MKLRYILKLRYIQAIIALLFLGTLSLAFYKPASPPFTDEPFFSALEQEIPELMKNTHTPGVALALIRQGNVDKLMTFGYADLENLVPVSKDTLFSAASLSKCVSAWGVMKLVEQHKLDLDSPIDQYVTRWHLPRSSYDHSQVTMRRLLSHSAGLSLDGYNGYPNRESFPTLEQSLSGENNGSGQVQVVHEPGTRYMYSGGGFTLAQLAIEEVTLQSFSDYMKNEILIPLGMLKSTYAWTPSLKASTALPYDSKGHPYPTFLFKEEAAAGLYTTVEEFAKFVAANSKDQGILQAATISSMFEPTPIRPNLIDSIYGRFQHKYGLGFVIEHQAGKTLISHSGNDWGMNNIFKLIPAEGEGFVVFTNGDSKKVYNSILKEWQRWRNL